VSLADVRERIARLQERLAGRVARYEPPPPRGARRVFRCGRCRERGHTWGRCPIRELRIWTSGTEIWIASSVADVAARFDLSAGEGHHVHIKGHYNDHLASRDAEPDVRDLDPRTFIEMVAKFLKDGEHPVRKKNS
jgi:hypothetical protein